MSDADRVFFFLLNFLSVLVVSANAQVDWDIKTEGGFSNSANNLSVKSSDVLFRMDGNLQYLYSQNDYSASVKFKVRPEIYGFNKNFRSIKFKALGDYYQKEDVINWGINLIVQKNFYYSQTADFNYSIFALSINADWYEFAKYPITTQIGYAYQTASENIEQNLDLLFIDIKAYKSLFHHNNFGYGFYIEKFSIENKYLSKLTNSENTNKGWRLGPQISFDYQDEEVVRIEYRFLMHSSQLTKYPSYENWIRLIAGKIFLDKWSVFLLADYYDRHFTLKENKFTETNLIYNPLDIENRINIKIAYEVSSPFEIYLKSGYFKENFFDQKYNFDGWNVLLGLEISD